MTIANSVRLYLSVVLITAGVVIIPLVEGAIGVIVGGVLAASGLCLLVCWHSRKYAYVCPECSHRFAITAFIDLLSPHFPDKKLLTCPKCLVKTWCHEVERRTI